MNVQFRYASIEATFTFGIISCVRCVSPAFAYILTDYIYTCESGYEVHIKQGGETLHRNDFSPTIACVLRNRRRNRDLRSEETSLCVNPDEFSE